MTFYVYILASRQHGTLYTGVTNDLARRVYEHRERTGGVFSRKYNTTKLVYYESFDQSEDAIAFEKRLKRWRRTWKVQVVEKMKPSWRDLYVDLNR
jgi:putative endonuclease